MCGPKTMNHVPLSRSLLPFIALLAAVVVCLDARQAARADDASPEAIGLAIAAEARARGEGFGNFAALQSMLLRNKQGRKSRRQLRIKALEVDGDGNKTIFVFDEPRDVKGTAFLIHSHRNGDDEQWLYLPALKRVKRISSLNRSGSFMGSEFAYEDLSTQEVEKFTHRYLRDEPCGDLTCTDPATVATHPRRDAATARTAGLPPHDDPDEAACCRTSSC